MIKVSSLSKSFGGRTVLHAVSFVVNAGECAGLVGPNGSGKTTLLRIVAGEEPADSGSCTISERGVAHLVQGYAGREHLPLARVFPSLFAGAVAEELAEHIQRDLEREGDPARAADLADELAAVERHLAAVARPGSSARHALGLRDVSPDEPAGALSGGELTKFGLLDVAASAPGALLLDEPTNNLDIAGLEWLDDYLTGFAGPILLVSHDRALLDDHATSVLELQPGIGQVEEFAGGYTAYAQEKARRGAEQWERYRRQQRNERRVAQEIRRIKQTARNRERSSQNDFYRRKAKKVARRAVVLERRLTRELAPDQRIEKPVRTPYRLKADVAGAPRSGDRMLELSGVPIAIEGRTLVRDVAMTIGWGERVVLAGANGCGKTTLLRTAVGELPPGAGDVRRSPSTRIGYLPQTDPLGGDSDQTPLDLIRSVSALSETEARRFLHRFLFTGDQPLTPVARLSYGERRRLALARLVAEGANLLVLDEPTNHLDIPSRESFESALEDFEGAMLVATHDRYFIDRFAERLLAIDGGILREQYLDA
jgi:ATP-binding cassette subfamily F protein 3